MDQAATQIYDQLMQYSEARTKSGQDLGPIKTSVFDILRNYFRQIMQLSEPLEWERAIQNASDDEGDEGSMSYEDSEEDAEQKEEKAA